MCRLALFSGWTKAELRAMMQELKDKYEMPGIGFYGSPPGNRSTHAPADVHDTATLELIEYANKVSVELWPDAPMV